MHEIKKRDLNGTSASALYTSGLFGAIERRDLTSVKEFLLEYNKEQLNEKQGNMSLNIPL